jgi:hypothetical protein
MPADHGDRSAGGAVPKRRLKRRLRAGGSDPAGAAGAGRQQHLEPADSVGGQTAGAATVPMLADNDLVPGPTVELR